MRKIFTVLFLVFIFQSLTKASDISEFEIGGMSIGDSLLDFMSVKEIENKEKNFHYATKDYYQIGIIDKSEIYDLVTVHIKNNDKKYKIVEIEGVLEITEKNHQSKKKCEDSMKDISDSLQKSFDLIKVKDEGKLSWDKTGKSIYKRNNFKFPNTNGFPITVICQYWHESTPFSYVLKTGLISEEFRHYLKTKAYN